MPRRGRGHSPRSARRGFRAGERRLVTHPLDRFANPRSIAVIGASTVPHKAGGRRWRSMVEAGFSGPLYPIHPSARDILGHRAYRSLDEVPGPVDLAVVLVRPDLVPDAISQCADLRVPAVVVITAGFGETGPAGKAVEREMVTRLQKGGGRMIGPNCAGLFSASGRVNALGWSAPSGPIAVISQSGNMALTFVQFAREKGLGFSKLITVGNAADIRIPEYVDYLLSDQDTRVIVAYLEGFAPLEGRALVEMLRGHPSPKPLVILKPGETESGRRAALSHTGALAGRHRIVEAARRHGPGPVAPARPGQRGGGLRRRRARDHRVRRRRPRRARGAAPRRGHPRG